MLNLFKNKNDMKHSIIRFLLVAGVLATSAACNKDFLDRKPLVGATEENFYRTEADAIAAINAAYAPLQFELSPAGHFRWIWGDVMSDDAIKGGSGDNDAIEMLQLETFTAQANNENVESEWSADYEGIYRANVVLERIPNIQMNEQLKARILGEARFIRAWFFYNLVTLYGGVPLADHVLAPSEYNLPRASESEVWTLVETDLREAAAALPLRSEYAVSDLGRITKGAAQSLLLKTLVWQQRWSEAQTLAEEIVNSNQYQLEPNYAKIFTQEGENGPLRQFRDEYLRRSVLGRAFIRFYYRYSPPVAAVIARHGSLRLLVRALLTPVVLAIEYPRTAAILALLVPGLLLAGRRGLRPRPLAADG